MINKKVEEFANELSLVLKYNKYLLDEPDTLRLVLEARLITYSNDMFTYGRTSNVFVDMSHLGLKVLDGAN